MSTIFNDESGIQNKSTFNAIKAILHPFVGKLKKGISEKAALRANMLSLRDVGNDIENLDFLKFFPNLKTFFNFFSKIIQRKRTEISNQSNLYRTIE